MALTDFTGDGLLLNGSYDFFDPYNWDNGLPRAGDTATIDTSTLPFPDPIALGDGSLAGLTVQLVHGELDGNVVTLSHSSVFCYDFGTLATSDLVVGNKSVISIPADTRLSPFMLVTADQVSNQDKKAQRHQKRRVYLAVGSDDLVTLVFDESVGPFKNVLQPSR